MNQKKRKVAVIGALNVDIGGKPEAAFVPGDSIPGRVSVTLGGVGWNIARNCASLGAETEFFSVLGRDEQETVIRRDAESFGVGLSHCRWEAAENNRYLYISGKNGDMVAAVNDMHLSEKIDAEFVRKSLEQSAAQDVIVLDANLSAGAIQAAVEQAKAPVVVDCVSAVKCGRLRGYLDRIHTLKANRMEAEMLAGQIEPEDCARVLMSAGVKRVVISLSGDGVLCGTEGAVFRLPASGMPIADTTGAGDSLTAALAVGFAHGLSLRECAALGMQAAGVTMGEIGAVTKKLEKLKLC